MRRFSGNQSVQQKLHNGVVHLKMHPNGSVRLAMRILHLRFLSSMKVGRQWKSFLYDRGQPKRGLDGVYITPRGANGHEPCCLFLRSLNDNVGSFSRSLSSRLEPFRTRRDEVLRDKTDRPKAKSTFCSPPLENDQAQNTSRTENRDPGIWIVVSGVIT